MTRAEQIQERLDEIGAELSAPPRPAQFPIERWIEDLENFCAVRSWPARQAQLIDEMRQLQREYERLPKHTKAVP